MRDGHGTLVLVEMRSRHDARHGGAAASIGATKQQRLVFAASPYLRRFAAPPPCRFDVVSVEGDRVEWRPAPIDASAG
jgi:putative endonuclease